MSDYCCCCDPSSSRLCGGREPPVRSRRGLRDEEDGGAVASHHQQHLLAQAAALWRDMGRVLPVLFVTTAAPGGSPFPMRALPASTERGERLARLLAEGRRYAIQRRFAPPITGLALVEPVSCAGAQDDPHLGAQACRPAARAGNEGQAKVAVLAPSDPEWQAFEAGTTSTHEPFDAAFARLMRRLRTAGRADARPVRGNRRRRGAARRRRQTHDKEDTIEQKDRPIT